MSNAPLSLLVSMICTLSSASTWIISRAADKYPLDKSFVECPITGIDWWLLPCQERMDLSTVRGSCLKADKGISSHHLIALSSLVDVGKQLDSVTTLHPFLNDDHAIDAIISTLIVGRELKHERKPAFQLQVQARITQRTNLGWPRLFSRIQPSEQDVFRQVKRKSWFRR